MDPQEVRRALAAEFSWSPELAKKVKKSVELISMECEKIRIECESELTPEEMKKLRRVIADSFGRLYTSLVIPIREKFPSLRDEQP